MKSIVARFQELKQDVAGTAESEFDDLDYNKVDKALKSVGISIKDATGQFRDLDDVFLELGKKWGSLSRNTQRYIATIAAGSRQQSRFLALMSDYGRTMELVNVAQNSAGRANEQFAKYADTVEYQVNKLKNTWEEFRTSLVSSDLVKSFLAIARNILSFVTELTNSYWKLIPTIINVVGLLKKFKDSFEPLKKAANKFADQFKKAFEDAKIDEKVEISGHKAAEDMGEAIKDAGHEVAEDFRQAINGEDYIPTEESGVETSTEGIEKDADKETEENTKEIAENTKEIKSFKSKVMAKLPMIMNTLSYALKGFEIGLIANSWFQSKVRDATEERENKWSYALSKTESSPSTSSYKVAENTTRTLEEAKNSIQELSSKTYLSAEQQEELNNAISLMNESYPQYVAAYDENTGKIELLTSKIDEEIEVQKQQNEYLLQQNLGKIGYERSSGYGALEEALREQTASTSEFHDWLEENQTAITSAGIIGNVTRTSTGGGIVGSTIAPGIGTAIGIGVGAVVGLIESLVASQLFVQSNENTATPEEFVTKVGSLDADTQQKIFNAINKTLNTSIETVEELNNYLDENHDDLGQILETTTNILNEVKHEAATQDAIAAVQSAIQTGKYGATQEQLTENEAKLLHDAVTTAFEGIYNEDTLTFNQGENILTVFEKEKNQLGNNTDLTELEQTMAYLSSIEGFSWVKNVINTLDDINSLPHEFTDLTKAQQTNLKPLKDVWEDIVPTGGADEDDLHADFAEAIVEMAFGKEALNIVQDNFQDALDTAFNDKSGLLQQAREWVNATNKTSGLTLEQFNQQREQLLDKVAAHVWSSDANIQKQIVDFVSNLITGVTPSKEVIEGSSSDINQKVAPKLAKLKEYFSDELIDSLSIESANTLESVMNTGLDNDNWNKIAEIINKQLTSIPDNLSPTAKTSLQNYITNMLTPENFDVTKMEEYIAAIAAITGNTKTATDITKGLWQEYESNNIDIVRHSFEELSESMDNTIKNTKSLIGSWSTFEKVFEASLSSTGASATDILSLAETSLAFALNEDGSINLQKAYTDYGTYLESEIEAIDGQYREALKEAGNDQKKIAEAEQKRQAEIIAVKTETLSLPAKLQEQEDKLSKARDNAHKKYRKALDEERKAVKKLADALKEQEEAYHGSDTWVAQVSGTFEIDNAQKTLNADAELYNLKLKDAKELTDALALSSQKNANLHKQDVLSGIEQLEYQKADEALLQNINNLASKYGITDPFNMDQIYSSEVPDIIRDRLIKMLEVHQTYSDEEQKLQKEDLERLQNYQNEQKDLLNKRVSFLQNGANIMKEAAEKEVKDLKEKCESMKDADDDYLDALEDAIDRQRNLRNREKEMNELATKEKKLSLLSRDTSGANEKERLKLEKEIQEDRQKTLDNTVDDLLKELKRQSEEREKERQATIDATESINEATNWIKQFTEIAQNWTSQTEVLDWFNTISPSLVDKTPEEIQQTENSFLDAWTEQLPYLAIAQDGFTEFTQATLDEIVAQQEEYHTTLEEIEDRTTTKTIEDLEKLQSTADDAAASAQDALDTAQETLANAKKDWEEADLQWENYLAQTKNLTQDYLKELVQNYIEAIDEMIKKNAEAGVEATRNKIAENRNKDLTKAEELTQQYNALDSTAAKSEFARTAEKMGYSYIDGAFRVNDTGMQKIRDAYRESTEATAQYNAIKDSAGQTARKAQLLSQGYIYENGQFKSRSLVELSDSLMTMGGYYDAYNAANEAVSKTYVNKNYNASEEVKQNELNKIRNRIAIEKAFSDLSEDRFNKDGNQYRITSSSGDVRYTGNKTIAKRFFDAGYEVKEKDLNGGAKNSYTFSAFAKGGLVNYTGPAWVDGTPRKPEAFLSYEDTRNIGELTKALSLSSLFTPSSQTPVSSSIGDTSIEININVENISDDYDVDRLVERVHQDILETARPTGTPVILRKN